MDKESQPTESLPSESVPAAARRQHGAFTRVQAQASGLSDRMIDAAVARGEWLRLRRGVYAVAGTPGTDLQRLMAAVLAAGRGAMASHQAAAWLWDLHDAADPAVIVPANRKPKLAGVEVHRRLPLPEASRRHGIPVTNPLRTVLDLGATSLDVAERAIDRGLAHRLFTVAGVEAELARQAAPGRKGVANLRTALDRRLATERRPPSVLESRMGRLLRDAGLPLPEAEYEVGRHRLDFAWPVQRVAVEVDGFADHSSLDQFGADRRRQNELVLAGWLLLRFTWDDVCQRPAEVAARIRRAVEVSRPA